MAASTPNPKKRRRRSAGPETAPAPAPSRIRNTRQQKIVETVEGYESIVSYGSALWVIHIVWVAVGLAVTGLGAAVIALGDSDGGLTALRLYQSLGYGMALLTIVTVLAAIVWAGQAYFNVNKLGRTPSIPQVAIVGRHVPAIVIGAALLFASGAVSALERPLRLLGGFTLVWGLMILAGVGHALLHQLWRSSALGDPSAESPNRDFSAWFIGLLVFVYGSAGSESLNDITISATGFLVFLTGLGILLAALMALRFIPLIGQRQEDRLTAIMMSFSDEDLGSQPVTAQQIEDAWEASSDLFSVDF